MNQKLFEKFMNREVVITLQKNINYFPHLLGSPQDYQTFSGVVMGVEIDFLILDYKIGFRKIYFHDIESIEFEDEKQEVTTIIPKKDEIFPENFPIKEEQTSNYNPYKIEIIP